jgi:hypothetical protein
MSQKAISEFRSLEAQARLGGGTDRIDQQHAKGKHTARERLEMRMRWVTASSPAVAWWQVVRSASLPRTLLCTAGR